MNSEPSYVPSSVDSNGYISMLLTSVSGPNLTMLLCGCMMPHVRANKLSENQIA